MKSYLEIFIVTFDTDKAVKYVKKKLNITNLNRDPDDIVNEAIKGPLKKSPIVREEKCIVHSTSWRYEGQGSIVLTYMVYSDHVNFQEVEPKLLGLKNMRIAQSKDPRKPRPQGLQEGDIVIHGIRHIGFLINTDGDRFGRLLNLKTQLIFQTMQFELSGKIN